MRVSPSSLYVVVADVCLFVAKMREGKAIRMIRFLVIIITLRELPILHCNIITFPIFALLVFMFFTPLGGIVKGDIQYII